MFALLLVLSACSDYSIINNNREIVYVYGEDTADPMGYDTTSRPIWVDSFTQISSMNGIDIVWVIDRSGSMSDNDDKLEQGLDTMLTILNQEFAVNWRIGIITTDPSESEQNQSFPLIYGDDYSTAMSKVDQLSNFARKENGFSAFKAYYNNDYSQTWMRHNASLLVIFVSDEDDQSTDEFPMADDFTFWYSNLRPQAMIASIVIPNEESCENTIGHRYVQSTSDLQGEIVDICSEDWSPSVRSITDRLQPYEEWYLSHTPLYGENGIYIFENGSLMDTAEWHYDSAENKVVFDIMVSGGSLIEISYEY